LLLFVDLAAETY